MGNNNWLRTTIGDQVTLQRGYDITKATQRPGAVPVVSAAGILSYHDKALFDGPGVVIGRKGNGIGRPHYVDRPYWPHDTSLFVRDFHGNYPKFVYYFFKMMFPQLNAMDVGSANPTLNRNHVHLLKTTWPPRHEQHRIADILGSLDDKIELNRRMNETLEAMARRLFRSWFVDFDPVHAKAALRRQHPKLSNPDLSRRALPNLAPEIAELFPDSFEDSSLGPIPKGWTYRALSEVAEIQSGGTPRRNKVELWNGAIPWVSPKSMTRIHVHDSEERVSSAAVGNGTRLVPQGTVLVMVRGMGLHQGVRISQATRDVTFNQDVKAVVPREVPSAVLLFALLTAANSLLEKVHASGHGTGVLSTEFLQRLPIMVPTTGFLRAAAGVLESLNQAMISNDRETDHLTLCREQLLPRLLSGSLPIPVELDEQ